MFSRSFVKQYCTALGIDPKTLTVEINAAVPLEEEDPLPALSENYQAPHAMPRRPSIKTSWLVVLFIGAIAGSSGFYAWYQKLQHRPEGAVQASSPPSHGVVAPAPAVTAPVSPTPAAPPPVAAVAAAPVEVPDPNKMKLALEATERTWISLSADGKTLFAGILSPSERKELEGLEYAKLVTGNAAGLDVRWNGKSLGSLGNRGQVRTIIFTPQKYEFVAPPPKKPAGLG